MRITSGAERFRLSVFSCASAWTVSSRLRALSTNGAGAGGGAGAATAGAGTLDTGGGTFDAGGGAGALGALEQAASSRIASMPVRLAFGANRRAKVECLHMAV